MSCKVNFPRKKPCLFCTCWFACTLAQHLSNERGWGLAQSPSRRPRIIDHHGSSRRKGISEDDLLSCFALPFSSSLHSTFMVEVAKCHLVFVKLSPHPASELFIEFTLSNWPKLRVGVCFSKPTRHLSTSCRLGWVSAQFWSHTTQAHRRHALLTDSHRSTLTYLGEKRGMKTTSLLYFFGRARTLTMMYRVRGVFLAQCVLFLET